MTLDLLDRRLGRLRAAQQQAHGSAEAAAGGAASSARSELAVRLADAVDGEVIRSRAGAFVRRERPSIALLVDRHRLARLPRQPPPTVPLVCLDTETTGLGTAAGTLAFLVGLGWWEGDRFRQVELLLPDQSDEPAFLAAVERHIPPTAWLVTYNGRGFDWPLLVTRYRQAGRGAPLHAGHLDLLPIVRRVFRHRLGDARLRTVETGLLGVRRVADVEGLEIPGRYLDFLRGGPAEQLIEVVRHNHEDVRSLARLLGHLEACYGDEAARGGAPRGDLAGLARDYARERRLAEALACYDAALAAPDPSIRDPFGRTPLPTVATEEPWWSVRRRPDVGGAPQRAAAAGAIATVAGAFASAGTSGHERIAIERALVLGKLGRWTDAVEAWRAITAGGGLVAIHAWIEVAKLLEHRFDDATGALAATTAAGRLLDRRRAMGRTSPRLELDLVRRARRLVTRIERRAYPSGGGQRADRFA